MPSESTDGCEGRQQLTDLRRSRMLSIHYLGKFSLHNNHNDFCSNNPVNLPDRARAQISADTGNRRLNCEGAYTNIHVEGAEWYRLGQQDGMPRREFTKRK